MANDNNAPKRLTVYWRIAWQPWWRWVFIALFVIATFDTIQAQLIPKAWQEQVPTVYEVIENVFPGWPWWTWTIMGLILLVVTILDGAYREIRNMLVSGRPKDVPANIWDSLEQKTSLVERDFTGPKGVKEEFKSILGDLLDDHKRKQKEQAVNSLSDLLNDGTHIYQRRVQGDEEYKAWKADMDRWVREVATLLKENFGKPEETPFLMLESVLAADIMGSYNKEHNNELLHLDQRLKKLRRIIEKHS